MKRFAFFGRATATAAVAPLRIATPFEQKLKPLLHALLLSEPSSSSTTCSYNWLLQALQASATTQNIALDTLKSIACLHSDLTIIGNYLEDNVKVLDACNQLSEKMEVVQEYIKSLRVVFHLLEGHLKPNPTTLARALDLLNSSSDTIERRFREVSSLSKCNFSLSSKKVAHQDCTSEYSEILNGSMAMASMVCGILGIALSFKSKRLQRLPSPTAFDQYCSEFNKQYKGRKAGSSSSSSMMLSELRQTLKVARDLQHHIKSSNRSGLKVVTEELKSRCDDLEGQIMTLDRGVRDLYKHLISFRMALLGTLSLA